MAAIVFDVRNAERRLKAAGASEDLAEATADLMSEAVLFNLDALVTRDYLDARLDAHFSELDVRFKEIDARFTEIDARFTEIDARFAEIDARFAAIDARFTAIDARFTAIEARFTEIEARFTEIEARFTEIEARFDVTDGRIGSLRTEFMTAMKSEFRLVHAMLALLMAGVIIPQLQSWLGA